MNILELITSIWTWIFGNSKTIFSFKKEKSNTSANIGKNNTTVNNIGDNNITIVNFPNSKFENENWSSMYKFYYSISKEEKQHITSVIKNKLINDRNLILHLNKDSIFDKKNNNSRETINEFAVKYFIKYWNNNPKKYKIPKNIKIDINEKDSRDAILNDVLIKLVLTKNSKNYLELNIRAIVISDIVKRTFK